MSDTQTKRLSSSGAKKRELINPLFWREKVMVKMEKNLQHDHSDGVDYYLISFLPKNKHESWKVEQAEKEFSLDCMLEYYGYAIALRSNLYMPLKHRQKISCYIDTGIYDDILGRYNRPELSESLIYNGRFYYKQNAYDPPFGYYPEMRCVRNGKIFVDCLTPDLKRQGFMFELEEFVDCKQAPVVKWVPEQVCKC